MCVLTLYDLCKVSSVCVVVVYLFRYASVGFCVKCTVSWYAWCFLLLYSLSFCNVVDAIGDYVVEAYSIIGLVTACMLRAMSF